MPALQDKTVLIIGRGSGIARAIALASTASRRKGSVRYRRHSLPRPGRHNRHD